MARWCIFGSKVWLELWKSDGMYKNNIQVEVLSVVDLRKTRKRSWAVQHRWVRVRGSHMTYTSSGYGYDESVTEVT